MIRFDSPPGGANRSAAVRYDSAVIYAFAQQLESKALLMETLYSIAGALLGVFVGYGFGDSVLRLSEASSNPGALGGLIGFVLGGFLGYLAGSARAFWIRLALHRMLCEVQIEENTRALCRLLARNGGS